MYFPQAFDFNVFVILLPFTRYLKTSCDILFRVSIKSGVPLTMLICGAFPVTSNLQAPSLLVACVSFIDIIVHLKWQKYIIYSFVYFIKRRVNLCILHSLYSGIDVELQETPKILCFITVTVVYRRHQRPNVINNFHDVVFRFYQLHICQRSYLCYL